MNDRAEALADHIAHLRDELHWRSRKMADLEKALKAMVEMWESHVRPDDSNDRLQFAKKVLVASVDWT